MDPGRRSLQLEIHGKGNAWPVLLGTEHPFYDRALPGDLSNASYSLLITEGQRILADLLVDAGHGTVQDMVSGRNRIPDCICLTHGHMDHTLGVDWVVQSHRRAKGSEERYPVYATRPVFEFFVRSYPHLEPMVMHLDLPWGVEREITHAPGFTVTAFPVYHGQGAPGAAMLLFRAAEMRVLFSGDLLSTLLRSRDLEQLRGIDLLVVDTNNRFPWPVTNHWSFAGSRDDPGRRGKILEEFIANHTWKELLVPHGGIGPEGARGDYFRELFSEGEPRSQSFTILEFLRSLHPATILPVHYSGTEDQKHHGEAILNPHGLQQWMESLARTAGILSDWTFPESGQVLTLA